MAARPVRVLSLCTGAGGLDLGIRVAVPTARTVCYVEREAYPIALLEARIADEAMDDAPIWSDLKTFDGTAWRGAVDLVVAGFPCQPASVAGKRRGRSDERWLWPHVWRIYRECGARVLFIENVGGLRSRHLMGAVLTDLAQGGCTAEWTSLQAGEVGASHRRERLFLLAYAGGIKRGQHSEPNGYPIPPSANGHTLGDDVSGRDQAVAHSEKYRWQQRGAEPAVYEWGDRSVGWGSALGHAADVRGLAVLGNEPDTVSIDLGVFAPGPADLDMWQRVLAVSPDLEPAICRMADGLAFRVDRLRACGNGVVPLQAAAAFAVLAHRLVRA